jgi:2-oxoisovalerate dehydrogenase E1 component
VNSATHTTKTIDVKVLGLSKEDLIQAYRTMLLSRRMDEKQLLILKQGKSFFHSGFATTRL